MNGESIQSFLGPVMGGYRDSRVRTILFSLLLALTAEAQKPAEEAKPAEGGDAQKRVELNLLGKEDATKGESRRNENVQFNLVDNNALKELNVRLGATATLVQEFRADRGYFGAEFGKDRKSTRLNSSH